MVLLRGDQMHMHPIDEKMFFMSGMGAVRSLPKINRQRNEQTSTRRPSVARSCRRSWMKRATKVERTFATTNGPTSMALLATPRFK